VRRTKRSSVVSISPVRNGTCRSAMVVYPSHLRKLAIRLRGRLRIVRCRFELVPKPLRLLFAFLGSILIVGCTNAIRIPLDGTSLSNTQSTVIVWMDQKPTLINQDVLIFVDGSEVGTISAKVPLKFAINPGNHRIYGSVQHPLFIRRQIEIDLKPGEVSFYRTYVQCGMWVCSVYTSPTEPSTYYDSVIHKLHDN
jgi:hypothetical protein